MLQYLWDLNLEDIPCGWENIYQEALQNTPTGELIASKESYDDDIHKYYYDPVKYHNLIIKTFSNYKQKAIEYVNKQQALPLKEFISSIVRIDAILYNLLVSWITPEDELSFTSFNPNNLMNEIEYAYYIDDNDTFGLQDLKQYNELKLINFS